MNLTLNARQKHALCKIYACADFLRQAVDEADKHMPKDSLSELRHASTRARKSWKSWFEQLDDSARRGVANIVRDYEIGILPKRQASAGVKEMQSYLTGKEYVERMAAITIDAKCRICDGGCKDTCPLYECYRHFEVPAFDPNHPKCEYSMIEVTG